MKNTCTATAGALAQHACPEYSGGWATPALDLLPGRPLPGETPRDFPRDGKSSRPLAESRWRRTERFLTDLTCSSSSNTRQLPAQPIMNSLRLARAALRARPAVLRAPLQRRTYADAVPDKASKPAPPIPSDRRRRDARENTQR